MKRYKFHYLYLYPVLNIINIDSQEIEVKLEYRNGIKLLEGQIVERLYSVAVCVCMCAIYNVLSIFIYFTDHDKVIIT